MITYISLKMNCQTYQSSSRKHIFHNGQLIHNGNCNIIEGIISLSALEILCLKASV